MAELNLKSFCKTIQSQVDRVTISPEALKKRAFDAALSAIQNSNQAPVEAESASGDNVESNSYADKVVQNAFEKAKEIREKKEENIQKLADSIRDKAKEAKEKEAVAEKERYEREATPF